MIDGPEVPATCGPNLSDLFASSQSDKQRDCGPCLFTKDAARTHIPVCFRSSTQAQSQGFPLSDRVKKGYNITSFAVSEGLVWSSFGRRDSCHSLFETFPDGGFMGSQDVPVFVEHRRGERPSGWEEPIGFHP